MCAAIFGIRDPCRAHVRARSRRRPCSSRTSCATSAWTTGAGAAICRWRISRGSAAPRRTSRVRRPGGRRDWTTIASARCSTSRPRAPGSSSRARRARCPKGDGSRFAAAEIMRAIYWDLLRRIEANQLRRLSRGHPRAEARPGLARAEDLVVAPGMNVRRGGDRRRIRRSQRRRPPRRRRPEGRRHRIGASPGRPRLGLHRSRHERTRRQRPARAVRLLSRHLRVPAEARHRRPGAARLAPGDWPSRRRRPAARALVSAAAAAVPPGGRDPEMARGVDSRSAQRPEAVAGSAGRAPRRRSRSRRACAGAI